MKDTTRSALSKLALFGAALIWGSSFFVVKDAVESLPPAALMAVRFSIAAAVLTLVFWKRVRGIRLADWPKGIALGACLACATIVQNMGIMDTTPGKNAFLTAVYVVLVPFLFWMFRGGKPRAKQFVAAFVCLVGIGLVSLDGNLSMGKGDLLSMASGLFYAIHIVIVATYARDLEPVRLTVMQFVCAAALQWVYTLGFEGGAAALAACDASVWPMVVYLAVVVSAGGYLCQIIGQRGAPPAAASLILSLESVFGVLFSVLFYGEQVSPRLGLGFAVIFAAILISEMEFKKAPLVKARHNL